MPEPSNNLLFARQKNSTPLHVIADDIRAASVPNEYFHSLLKGRGIRNASVTDLSPSRLHDQAKTGMERFQGSSLQSSLLFSDREQFLIAATEILIAGSASVVYLNPSSIALAQIRNTLRGAPSAVSFVEEADFLFIDDLVTEHTRRLFTAEPTAAAHFHEFLRLVKYTLANRVVFCAKGISQGKLPDELSLTYTDSLVELINSGLGYVGDCK